MRRRVVVLHLLLASFYTVSSQDNGLPYIGCYKDDENDPDLRGATLTYTSNTLTAEGCRGVCLSQGFPYAGLKGGVTCLCGTTYGKHGAETDTQAPVQCSYLCNGQTEYCGGDSSNSIYYSVSTDTASLDARSLVAHSETADFDTAREQCVTHRGDLATAESAQAQDQLITLLEEAGVTSGEFWIGLRLLNTNDGYQWTDPTVTQFENTAFTSEWDAGENPPLSDEDCVSVDMTSKKWKSSNCYSQQLAYVCNQQPEQADNLLDSSSGSSSDSSSGSKNLMALIIVLPIFAICYGGSCLLYCIYKMYRNFKHRKNNSFLVKDDRFNSLESAPATPGPGTITGPIAGVGPGPTVDKFNEYPPERHNYPFKNGYPPKQEVFPSAGGYPSKGHTNKAIDDDDPAPESVPVTPVRSPQSPGAFTSPGPDDSRPPTRHNLRKALLLERAANEARARRQTPEPADNPWRGTPAPLPPQQPSPSNRSSWRAKSRAADYEVPAEGQQSPGQKSNDSSSALLPEDNPMSMSIADILRVKRMMKETRNKRHIQAT